MGANNPVCTFRNFAYAINGFRIQKPNSISSQCQAFACGLSETRSSASIYIAPERIRAGRNIIKLRFGKRGATETRQGPLFKAKTAVAKKRHHRCDKSVEIGVEVR